MQIIAIAGCGICIGIMWIGRCIGGFKNDQADHLDP